MNFIYNETQVFYKFINNNKKVNTIILPGWMNNHNTYECLFDILNSYSNIYVIDFPGFKYSQDPKTVVDLNYYVDLLNYFIEELDIKNVVLLGHSFGGRVAIKYQSIYKTALYLILTDSAGIKRFKIKSFIKIKLYKLKKKIYKITSKSKYINLIQTSGSKDYLSLNEKMKETFKNIINEDLRRCCRKITCPTLLIWGTNDKETKINDGLLMNKLIKTSTLIKIEDAGHFPFFDKHYQYCKILDSFYNYILEELLLI